MSEPLPSIAEVLPHTAPMILLDRVVSWQADKISCEVEIGENSHLFNDLKQAVPSYVSIEYMAQAVAALAGLEAKAKQQEVEVGFLIGTRKCQLKRSEFSLGTKLTVSAERIYAEEDGLAVCACEVIDEDGSMLTSAHLNVYQPKNAVEFVKGS